MIEIYSYGASVIILAILLIFLPFRLTWKGKITVYICTVIISGILFLGSSMFELWFLFPIIILLTALMSYIIRNRVSLFHTTFMKYSGTNQMVKPLFSFSELKEKAENADTMDIYYMQSINLKKKELNHLETSTTSIGQVEIDKLLQQHREVAATSDEEIKEEFIVEAKGNNQDLEVTEFDLPLQENIFEETLSNVHRRNEEFDIELLQEDSIDVNARVKVSEEEKLTAGSSREFNLEEIDNELVDQRNSWNEEKIIDIDKELDLIEIRRKLFTELEDTIVVGTEKSVMAENGDPLPSENRKQANNRSSSQQLEDEFDDLEEHYRKIKNNIENREEHE